MARCVSAGSASSVPLTDRKSTRLNSSHLVISYAVFCLKKKNKQPRSLPPPHSSLHCCRCSSKRNATTPPLVAPSSRTISAISKLTTAAGDHAYAQHD